MKRRPWETEVGEMSPTGLLISQFKMLDLKKMMVKHSYFMTALLTYAMNKTEI